MCRIGATFFVEQGSGSVLGCALLRSSLRPLSLRLGLSRSLPSGVIAPSSFLSSRGANRYGVEDRKSSTMAAAQNAEFISAKARVRLERSTMSR